MSSSLFSRLESQEWLKCSGVEHKSLTISFVLLISDIVDIDIIMCFDEY